MKMIILMRKNIYVKLVMMNSMRMKTAGAFHNIDIDY